jgi:hypothetical protein
MSPIAERIRRRFCHLGLALVLLAGGAVTDAAATGRICTSDDTFMFGNRAVGSSTMANATVTNCGDASWSFTDVSVHPATGPAFHVSTTCTTGLTLAPGATCTVSVGFAPTTPGQTSGGLWLHNTTTTPDQLITFYGRGVDGQNGTASLAFVPASADFPAQVVGTQSMPLTVELHNQGPAALTLSALVLNGPEAYDFVVRNSTCQVGAAIAAGDSCHMWFYFRPLAAGNRRANLVIDSPQLSSLAIMQISGAAQEDAPLNYSGLFWNSPAGSESGWGINFAHQGDVIFASWFTYDLTGKGWWLVMNAPNTGGNTFSGPLLTVTGPAFDAVPFDPNQVVGTSVGTGTLTFTDANNGTFAYTVNGISQTKAITREVFGTPPVCTFGAQPDLALATNYQDLWWNTPALSESGWGVNFAHQGDTIFATWFTYDHDHAPMWLVVTANKSGPGMYSGTLFRTTGPAFNAVPFNPMSVVGINVGTATFTFTNGNIATFAYTVNGVSQTKTITREIFRPPGTVCQ